MVLLLTVTLGIIQRITVPELHCRAHSTGRPLAHLCPALQDFKSLELHGPGRAQLWAEVLLCLRSPSLLSPLTLKGKLRSVGVSALGFWLSIDKFTHIYPWSTSSQEDWGAALWVSGPKETPVPQTPKGSLHIQSKLNYWRISGIR